MDSASRQEEMASPEMATPAVRLRDVWFSYAKKEPVLRAVSMDVAEGELLMVLGASGSGKSTLLKLVKGLLAPQRGEILLFGSPLRAGHARDHLDPATAYIPQQLGLIRSRTVIENTLMGALGRTDSWRALVGAFPRDTVALAHETIGVLGLSHKTNERVRSLSGGERQRVAIARALVQQPRVLIADELVSQLDPGTTAEIMQLIRQVAASGVTVLMTTHELHVVVEFADELAILRNGEKVVQSPARGMTPAELERMMKP